MFSKADLFINGETADNSIKETIYAVDSIVTPTMGPDGKVVVIENGTSVNTTKDGATVARAITFKDPFKENINRIIAESAIKTELECGDGTTTTIFLTKLFYDLFRKYPGYAMNKTITAFVEEVIVCLQDHSIKVDIDSKELYEMATITANGDQSIVDSIIGIYRDASGTPKIELVEGVESVDKVMRSDGITMRMNYAHPVLSADGNNAVGIYDNVHVIGLTGRCTANGHTQNQLRDKLEKLAGDLPVGDMIIVVAQSFGEEIIGVMQSINSTYGRHLYMAAKTNMGGGVGAQIVGDICAVTNGKVYPSLMDVETVPPVFEQPLTMDGNQTVVPGLYKVGDCRGKQAIMDRIKTRTSTIDRELDGMGSGSKYKPSYKAALHRKAELNSELVRVAVGGETPNDIRERRDRFEDVALAVGSALGYGVLPGVGVGLMRAFNEVLLKRFLAPKSVEEIIKEAQETAEYAGTTKESVYAICANLINSHVSERINKSDDQFLCDMFELGRAQYDLLTDPFDKDALVNGLVADLRTKDNRFGSPEQFGIYDAAMASIIALRGGLATAKILANTHAVILGNKHGSINF